MGIQEYTQLSPTFEAFLVFTDVLFSFSFPILNKRFEISIVLKSDLIIVYKKNTYIESMKLFSIGHIIET